MRRHLGDRASAGEAALFNAVADLGLNPTRRYTINSKHLPPRPHCAFGTTTPDVTLLPERVAIYYDGCYWHECPDHYPGRHGGVATKRDRRV